MPIFPKKSTSRFIVLFLFVMLALSGIGYSIYLVAFGVHDINTLFIALIFLSLTLISGFFNIFIANSYYRSAFYNEYLDGINKGLKPLRSFPAVAISRAEYSTRRSRRSRPTCLQLKTMNYPKERLRFYLLDDSTDSEKASELKIFARSNGIRYIHRKEDRKGFKAGALNNMLKHSKEEFLAVFDFDEYLTNPDFLMDSLPYFNDKKLSYIQTEKRYFKGTFFSDTVDLFDAYFFQFVQPSRALNNTAIFAWVVRPAAEIRRGCCGWIPGVHNRGHLLQLRIRHARLQEPLSSQGVRLRPAHNNVHGPGQAAVEVQLWRHPVPLLLHEQDQAEGRQEAVAHVKDRLLHPRLRPELRLGHTPSLHADVHTRCLLFVRTRPA